MDDQGTPWSARRADHEPPVVLGRQHGGGRPGGHRSNAGRLHRGGRRHRAVDGRGIKEIEHVVILMQENRSFDHYFGTLSGVARLLGPAGAQADVWTARGTRSSTSSATRPASASIPPGSSSRSTR